jgi:ABC-2 type transport system ATP-binding protein
MTTLRRLDDRRVTVLDIGMRRPTLDDVFLTLTGRVAEDDPADAPAHVGIREEVA